MIYCPGVDKPFENTYNFKEDMGKTYKDRSAFSAYEKIKVPRDTSICFVGDIHEHPEQFFKLVDQYKPGENRWIVSVGDVCDKGYGPNAARKITEELKEYQKKGFGFAVRGNHELKILKKARKSKDSTPDWLKWWAKQPLVISFEFPRGSIVTTLHAGVTPKMTSNDLGSDIEVVYVRDVDNIGKMIPLIWINGEDGKKALIPAREGGTPWHEKYDGRFGYIVSGHAAQKDGVPKFYNYSANIDSGVYETGILTGQVFTPDGKRGELIQVTGEAFKPKLEGENH